MKRRLLIPTLLLTLSGCSGLINTGRSFLSDNSSDDPESSGSFFDPRDFPVMAGDSGTYGERSPKTKEEIEHDRSTYALERELNELEDSQSENSLEMYNLHKHKFASTSEKIYFLKLPKGERRGYLVAKGMIKESQYKFSDNSRSKAIRATDVMMGMSKNDVMDSWGRPVRVEVAGNPSYENERWAYSKNGATKYIYFEGGRVEGWE